MAVSFAQMVENAARAGLSNGGAEALLGLAFLPVGAAAGAASAAGRSGIDHAVEQKMPSGGMSVDYQVNWVPGPPQRNARLKRALGQAAYMQTEAEHNEALTYYLKRLPRNATVAKVNEAIRKGIMRERELRKFWAGNRTLRDYISPSSSAVSSVRIDPSNNVVVKFGNNPKEYAYRGGANPYLAAQEAAKLVLSPSIGRAINGAWGKTHKLF